METKGNIKLKARLILSFDLEAVTGLHIGGSYESISIGGVDKTVIRDPLTNRPYIPGSSLRGKMRSLVEKYGGKAQNQRINQGYIHSCQDDELKEYQTCEVCRVFGVPGERTFGTPTRLIVRDMHLSDDSAQKLQSLDTDFPFTEVKVEVAIDRVTSQANPRQLERVPAGTIFCGGEMVYSLYSGQFDGGKEHYFLDPEQDLKYFDTVLVGLQLLEDDYLGGSGGRGSGKVRLKNLKLGIKDGDTYPIQAYPVGKAGYDSLAELRQDWDNLKAAIMDRLK